MALQGGTTSSFHPLGKDHGGLSALETGAYYRMAREAVSPSATFETDPRPPVAVSDTGRRPPVAADDTGHQQQVAAFHTVAAVGFPQAEEAVADADRLEQAAAVVAGDTDPPPPAAAFDIDHPCLEVVVCDTGRPRMVVRQEATSGGSSEESPRPHDQWAWGEVCGPSHLPAQSWGHGETRT